MATRKLEATKIYARAGLIKLRTASVSIQEKTNNIMCSRTATLVLLFVILAAFQFACKTPSYTSKPEPENTTDSVKSAGLGAFGLEGVDKEQQVDMQQFRRKALNI